MKDKSCEYISRQIEDLLKKPHKVAEAYTTNFLANWEVIAKLRKPVIAAVSGYAVCSQTQLSVIMFSWRFFTLARRWLGARIAG